MRESRGMVASCLGISEELISSCVIDPRGVSSISIASPLHKNQDRFVSGTGCMAVMDGVSDPSSYNAARIVGATILKGMRGFKACVCEESNDPATLEGRKAIVKSLYKVMAQANEALNRYNTQRKYDALMRSGPLNWGIMSRVKDEATTAVLTVVVQGSDHNHYLFTFQAGDSESVVYEKATQKIKRLNPSLSSMQDLLPCNFKVEIDGSEIGGWRYGIDEGMPLPDYNPDDRLMWDPGNCFDDSEYWEPVVTVEKVQPEDLIITSSDGWGDNVNNAQLAEKIQSLGESFLLLTLLGNLREQLFDNPKKIDDITIGVARVADMSLDRIIREGETGAEVSCDQTQDLFDTLIHQFKRILLGSYNRRYTICTKIRRAMRSILADIGGGDDDDYLQGVALGEKYKSCLAKYEEFKEELNEEQIGEIDFVIGQIEDEVYREDSTLVATQEDSTLVATRKAAGNPFAS
jgi:serine/threonine protein phosphatase PrpC